MNIKDSIMPVLEELFNQFKSAAGDTWAIVEPQALDYKKETEMRLLSLALESTTGQLDAQFLADKAKEELEILKSQIISLGIITASETQAVINNAYQSVLIVIIQALTDKINERSA